MGPFCEHISNHNTDQALNVKCQCERMMKINGMANIGKPEYMVCNRSEQNLTQTSLSSAQFYIGMPVF